MAIIKFINNKVGLKKTLNYVCKEEKINKIKNTNLKYPEDYNIITILRNNINHLLNSAKTKARE